MAKKDYYDVLGVEKNCDDKSLKSAFRKLAKEYHPDHNAGNPESEAKFKEISEAYERLKNPETRAAYDRYGHAAFDGSREEALPRAGLMVIFPQHFLIYLTIFLVTFHRRQDLKKPRIEVLT